MSPSVRSNPRPDEDPLDGVPARVLLGLGANLGEPLVRLAEAVVGLRDYCDAVVLSSAYRSAPVGYADQPDFYNAVVAVRTALPPRDLLAGLQAVERSMGRTRSFRNAPRTIDLDLLAYADEVIDLPGLAVPHPRLHERGFVLYPLQEIVPTWRHPVTGRTPAEMIAMSGGLERVERVGPLVLGA